MKGGEDSELRFCPCDGDLLASSAFELEETVQPMKPIPDRFIVTVHDGLIRLSQRQNGAVMTTTTY